MLCPYTTESKIKYLLQINCVDGYKLYEYLADNSIAVVRKDNKIHLIFGSCV